MLVIFREVENYEAPTWPSSDVPMQVHLDFSVDEMEQAEAQLHRHGATTPEDQRHPDKFLVKLDPAGQAARWLAWFSSRAFADRVNCQMTTLNPMTETTSPARLIQSLTVITGSSVVNREKDKGRATLVLFLGETNCGAEPDLGTRAVLLRLAISQPPISQRADLPLLPSRIGGGHSRLPA